MTSASTAAYLYDAAWVLAKTIHRDGLGQRDYGVAAVLPSVCENHYGATGWCRLNEYGDRAPPPYDIWYYAPGATAPSVSLLAGTYDPDTRVTIWNTRTRVTLEPEPDAFKNPGHQPPPWSTSSNPTG